MCTLYVWFKRSLPLDLAAYLYIVRIQFWMIYRPFNGIEMHSFQTFMYLSSYSKIAIFKDYTKRGFFTFHEKKTFDLLNIFLTTYIFWKNNFISLSLEYKKTFKVQVGERFHIENNLKILFYGPMIVVRLTTSLILSNISLSLYAYFDYNIMNYDSMKI